MQQALQQVEGQAGNFAVASPPSGEQDQLGHTHGGGCEAERGKRHSALTPDLLTAASLGDQNLVQWLQELNVDSGTIQTVRGKVLAGCDCSNPKLHLCHLSAPLTLMQRL